MLTMPGILPRSASRISLRWVVAVSYLYMSVINVKRPIYETDLSDEEWQRICLLVDVAQQGPGPRRSVNLREVVNALLYKQFTGCQWRMLPHDLPPRSTVSGYFQRWSRSGTWAQVRMVLSGRDGRRGLTQNGRAGVVHRAVPTPQAALQQTQLDA